MIHDHINLIVSSKVSLSSSVSSSPSSDSSSSPKILAILSLRRTTVLYLEDSYFIALQREWSGWRSCSWVESCSFWFSKCFSWSSSSSIVSKNCRITTESTIISQHICCFFPESSILGQQFFIPWLGSQENPFLSLMRPGVPRWDQKAHLEVFQ